MRFNIKDYEAAFPRKAEPVTVKVVSDDPVDSVIEGSSEDSEPKKVDPDDGTKIYTGPEKPDVVDTEGGEESGNE